MTMPKDLIFIRHGESEANIVQKHDDHGVDMKTAAAIFARPDWRQRLAHREQADRRVVTVSRGDFINAARYGVERMTPEEWEELDEDRTHTIRNCTLLHYTRVNPLDPSDVRDKLRWRRYIYPDAPDASPDGGLWVELSERRRYSGSELIGQADRAAPRLLDDDIGS